MKRWLIAASLLPAVPALGDTVFLKNGAWIDGKVTLKTNTFVELQIGTIGKIQLPVEDIHSIEKNARTGRDSATPYVEPKGPSELLAKDKEKKAAEKKAADKKPEAKDAKAAVKPREKPAVEEKKKPEPAAKAEEKSDGDDSGEKAGEEKAGGHDAAKAGEDSPAGKSIDPDLKKRIQDLIADLSREKSRNRVQAERHLEAIGPPAIPFLLPLARSENELVRTAVMRLFHSFGDQQVIDAAIQGLLDENEYVRDFANKALKRITGEDFGYQSGAFPKRREIAYQKWVKWWEAEKKTMEEERKLSAKDR
jgi:HEAT repeat protein